MAAKHTLILDVDESTLRRLEKTILEPAGHSITRTTRTDKIPSGDFDLIFLGDLSGANLLDRIDPLLAAHPASPIILLTQRNRAGALSLQALEKGALACLAVPIRVEDVLTAVSQALTRRRQLLRWAAHDAGAETDPERTLHHVRAAAQPGQQAASITDLNDVLCYVIEQAVILTSAETGRLLLLAPDGDEFQLRASYDFEEQKAQIRQENGNNELAQRTAGSREPVLLERDAAQGTLDQEAVDRIWASHSENDSDVHALLYVPLSIGDRTIGVLGVENGSRREAAFEPANAAGLAAFAAYAAVAIDNAIQLSRSAEENRRSEEMLLASSAGIILIDENAHVLGINPIARKMLGLGDEDLAGRDVVRLFEDEDLVSMIEDPDLAKPIRLEFEPGDGRHFILHIHPIPGAGKTITLQEVTHFKELDQVKSDFVTAISHDLRSPLTAVLGYIELIGRVGDTNPQQQEFIHRIQDSVTNITDLIDDLLELGRIEADFDKYKERLPLSAIIQYSINGHRNRFEEKGQSLEVEIQPDIPEIFGSPIRLRQMIGNLLENANKYTSPGGSIRIVLRAENGQVILEVSDTGIGIPSEDLPHIFERLYRASNVSLDMPGTGLGLAIVRSIVVNHEGRFWCDSKLGSGSTFTIVLPTADY
jgi:two-component system NtrC family sensor kinase